MKFIELFILLLLTVFLGCKAGQNHSLMKTKKEIEVTMIGAPAPFVLFALESGDTLKFGGRDIYSLLNERIEQQIKRQGYLSEKSWQNLAGIIKNQDRDTVVFQNLSAINDRTIGGILDTWIARDLLLKGKAIVVLKGKAHIPERLRYVFLRDKLGGQQGNFYTDDYKLIYWSISALGE